MMSAFFESVNDYRDAMRAHVKDELHDPVEMCAPVGVSLAPAAAGAK
jgi:uncharacterized protein involved in outer membrane biogenesis